MPCMCGSECPCDGSCICTSQMCRCERCGRVPFRKRFLSPTEMEVARNDPNKSPTEEKEVEQETEYGESAHLRTSGSDQAIGQSTQIVLKESLSRVLCEPSKTAFRTETVIKFVGSKVSPQKRKYSTPEGSPPASTETFPSPTKKGKNSPIDLSINELNISEVTASSGSSHEEPPIQSVQTHHQNADIEQLRMNCGMTALIATQFECGDYIVHNCRTGCVLNLPTDSSSGIAAGSSNSVKCPTLVNILQAPPLNSSSSQVPQNRNPSQIRRQFRNIIKELGMTCNMPKLIELLYECGDRVFHNCRLGLIQSLPTDSSQRNAGSTLHGSSFDERQSQAETMNIAGPSNPSQDSVSEQLPSEEKGHESDDPDSLD